MINVYSTLHQEGYSMTSHIYLLFSGNNMCIFFILSMLSGTGSVLVLLLRQWIILDMSDVKTLSIILVTLVSIIMFDDILDREHRQKEPQGPA